MFSGRSLTMLQQRLTIGLLCALCSSFALVAQQAATVPVAIHVSDPTGANVAHAQVRLVPAADKSRSKLETDDKGRVSINLKPGPYALFVSAAGFKTTAQHVDVATAADKSSGSQVAGQVVQVTLQIGEVSSPTPIYPAGSAADRLVLVADPYHAPVSLSPAEFRALPHSTITVHNGHTKADESYSGVALGTLLAMVNAPIGDEFHEQALTSYLIATGSDGYSVLLSLAEIDPGFHAGQVIVADSRNGEPVGKLGPFQLIVTDDKRPARWVHNLVSISLMAAR